MASVLGSLLDPFTAMPADEDDQDDWPIFRLVVRSVGARWPGVALLLATTYRFVEMLVQASHAS